MKNRMWMKQMAVFLAAAALMLFLVIFITLAIGSQFITAQEVVWDIPPAEQILFWPDNPIISLILTLMGIGGLLVAHKLLIKTRRIHLMEMLCVLWVVAAVFWVWGTQMQPHIDFEMVSASAMEFAQNDFSIFDEDNYYHDCTYQLGITLMIEGIARLFPFADLVLLTQIINVGLVMLSVVVINSFSKELGISQKQQTATFLLYLLFLPMLLFCTYVYGTLPMMLMVVCAYLSYVRYIKYKKYWYGISCSVCLGIAAVLKPNAMIALAALCIVALLQALYKRDAHALLYVAMGAVLAIIVPRVVTWSYETRSGVEFRADMTMLSRLVMGLQDARMGPGWYNGYIAKFASHVMPAEEARRINIQDLILRLKEFADDPAMFIRFMSGKCSSMWLEPTYSTLWNGSYSVKTGPYNGLAIMLCREGMPLRELIEKYMDVFQQSMYVLICIGTGVQMKKRCEPVHILLPVLVLGGFFYHMLFEAKSQYIFVYAFFLMPMAAQGLMQIENGIAYHCKEKASWKKR